MSSYRFISFSSLFHRIFVICRFERLTRLNAKAQFATRQRVNIRSHRIYSITLHFAFVQFTRIKFSPQISDASMQIYARNFVITLLEHWIVRINAVTCRSKVLRFVNASKGVCWAAHLRLKPKQSRLLQESYKNAMKSLHTIRSSLKRYETQSGRFAR